ncbi:alpha/beta hydrolase [Streptomyces sp. NPDC060194]|uniref:alpha/beta hydrolase n=1 Tax=Streptomyces sp. NPDC060194 TaxID=3347069 RepID=UPI00364C26E3
MPSFAELYRQDFGDLEASASSWRALASALATARRDTGNSVSGPLHRAGWTGVAATAGLAALEASESQFLTAQMNAGLIASVVDGAAARLRAAQRTLRAVVSDAEDAGFTVSDDGRVTSRDPGGFVPEQNLARGAAPHAGDFPSRIRAALAEALEASQEAARLLQGLDPFALDKRYGADQAREDALLIADYRGVSVSDIPDGTDPRQAASWWAQLSVEDRLLYLAAWPERVGALDGLPADVRDEANRAALERLLLAETERYASVGTQGLPVYATLADLKRRLDHGDTNVAHQRLHLIAFDTGGDGRAVVSVGNPDGARHVAVSVPGTDNRLDNFGGQIERAEVLQAAALKRYSGPHHDVSVIAWLGYDAPEFQGGRNLLDGGVITQGRAHDSAERLRDFTAGVRVANHDGDPHLTVLGHSYGSTMVGRADRGGGGLGADDVIALGSPGLSVDKAEQLRTPEARVWVGAAPDDFVSNHLSGKTLGEDPKHPDFGARRIYVDTSGHSGYWAEGSQSLDNQGLIITGQKPLKGDGRP